MYANCSCYWCVMRLCRPVRPGPGKKQWPLREDDCEILRSSADYMQRKLSVVYMMLSVFIAGDRHTTCDRRYAYPRDRSLWGAHLFSDCTYKYYNIVRVAVYNPNREYEYEFCFVLVFFFSFFPPSPQRMIITHTSIVYEIYTRHIQDGPAVFSTRRGAGTD